MESCQLLSITVQDVIIYGFDINPIDADLLHIYYQTLSNAKKFVNLKFERVS
jgi:hypothetical protein